MRDTTPQDIKDRMDADLNELNKKNYELLKLGEEKGNTKAKYAIALRQELLRLRIEKYPSSISMELAKGENHIAKLRLQKDIAESRYFTQISAIENLRISIEVKRSQLAWLKAEMSNS